MQVPFHGLLALLRRATKQPFCRKIRSPFTCTAHFSTVFPWVKGSLVPSSVANQQLQQRIGAVVVVCRRRLLRRGPARRGGGGAGGAAGGAAAPRRGQLHGAAGGMRWSKRSGRSGKGESRGFGGVSTIFVFFVFFLGGGGGQVLGGVLVFFLFF